MTYVQWTKPRHSSPVQAVKMWNPWIHVCFAQQAIGDNSSVQPGKKRLFRLMEYSDTICFNADLWSISNYPVSYLPTRMKYENH
jgi:hypothetical protein